MKKYLLFALCTIVSLAVNAQDNTKYLKGAVPEVDGKVVFSKTIPVKNPISDDQLYGLMNKWAKENYTDDSDGLKNRILLSSADSKTIACAGEDYLEFKRSALSLDRAKMTYQLILEVKNGSCNVTMRGIRYDYSDSKKLLLAEEMITDEYALSKKGDKLNRYYDKFRQHTIDSVYSIYKSIDIYLNGINTAGAAASSMVAPASQTPTVTETTERAASLLPAEAVAAPLAQIQEVTHAAPSESNSPKADLTSAYLPGYKHISPDKIPGNIIKLLGDWMLITSGTADQTNVMTASWGGLGTFWEKPVSFCFLNPTRYSVQTMDKGDTYTISFYTEAYKEALKYCGSVSGKTTDKIKGSGLTPIKTPSGATAFSEAWMIFECKKIVAQPISPSSVVDKSLPDEWTKDGYHKMYIGEILNVWIK